MSIEAAIGITIKGAVGEWLGMIATFFVGTRGAVSVAAILRRR